ncbi:MAG: SRPBCC family protein [Candidatus Lernaella stagnicola]|nr:SRPBCC family protein [Candidatus Lernaella stagnicola]
MLFGAGNSRKWIALLVLTTLAWVTTATARQPSSRDVKTHKDHGVYQLEIDIEVPPDFLYPYLIYEDRIARWQKDDTVSVTFPDGLEPRIGKHIRVAIEAPTDPWFMMEIIKLDRPHEVRTEFVDGVLRGDFAYLLEPTEAGTRFVHEMRIKAVGTLTTIVWEMFGKHMHRQKMKSFMAKIKEIVEADYSARVTDDVADEIE